ncbi:hypothetical protein V6N12_033661 [Hibiscus sabdariffa]|uniref:Uncharacterized protein n=1 Tax=Hibiscus sabdariffa TaxID=183260 RepID=A0ABR2BXV9_9ROSI
MDSLLGLLQKDDKNVMTAAVQILEIFQAGTPVPQALAAGVLKILASFDEIKENFVEESTVFVFIGLAASGTAVAQENRLVVYVIWKERREWGCTTSWIKMLDEKAVEEKEAAAVAISTLVLYTGNQKLVEMNVEVAKKLLESLASGKIWGVFSRT